MKKKLAKYLVKHLADYLDYENSGRILAEDIVEGIEAFENTENVKVWIQDNKGNIHPKNMTECEDKKAEDLEIICDECESRKFCGG